MDEMRLGLRGFCPVVGTGGRAISRRGSLYEQGKKRESFDMFGRVLASTRSRMRASI